jgi:hypothetical protein
MSCVHMKAVLFSVHSILLSHTTIKNQCKHKYVTHLSTDEGQEDSRTIDRWVKLSLYLCLSYYPIKQDVRDI